MFKNHKLFLNASFLEFALKIDAEFAETARLKRCPHCNASLHYAHYKRKGRVVDLALPDGWELFHGLCCSNKGCRKRVRPPSIRYAGRSPFSVALYLLVELIQSGGSKRSVISLSKELNISQRTIRRWLLFWKKIYSESTWWRKIASIWMLSGKTLLQFWISLISIKNNLTNSFQYLLKNSADIWAEIKLFVGDRIPAKDA